MDKMVFVVLFIFSAPLFMVNVVAFGGEIDSSNGKAESTALGASGSSSQKITGELDPFVQQMAGLRDVAVDQALWQMEQANAMAKMKGIYSLAKTANEMT